jgi:AraC-like DNA-binding protein
MYGSVNVQSVTALATPLHDGQHASPSRKSLREVAALIVDRSYRARLTGALRPVAVLRFVQAIGEMQALLRDHSGEVSAVFTEAVDADGTHVSSALAEWRRLAPRAALIGFCRRPEVSPQDAVELARAGVHELVFSGVDDVGIALRNVLLSAEQSSAAERALAALRPLFASEVIPLIQHCLVYGKRPLRVEEVSRALGVHRKTLVNWCARAGLPAPERVIGWCRLCLVGALLEDTGYTVERIASLLDYASSTALRNTVQRYLGITATELRSRGGLAYVVSQFASRASESRAPAGVNSPP